MERKEKSGFRFTTDKTGKIVDRSAENKLSLTCVLDLKDLIEK